MKTVAGLDLCFAVVPFLSRGHVIENSHLNFCLSTSTRKQKSLGNMELMTT